MSVHLNRTIPSAPLPRESAPDNARYIRIHGADEGGPLLLDRHSLDLYVDDGLPPEIPPPQEEAPVHPLCTAPEVRALLLHLTLRCPLRCVYCYERAATPEKDMSFETAQKAIDALIPAKPTGQVQIAFFGGEPVLCKGNIERIVGYARARFGRQVRFGITTGATLMNTAFADFLGREHFSAIVSLDGPKTIHDAFRHGPGGTPTWERTMRGLKEMARLRKITLRATYTSKQIRLLERLQFLNDLCDQGLASGVSVEPAFATESGCVAADPFFKSPQRLQELRSEFERAEKWMAHRILDGYPARWKNVEVYLQRLLHKTPWCTACGAGMGYVAVDGDGIIYACHRRGGTRIGSLAEGIKPEHRQRWKDNRATAHKECRDCDLLHVCGGPCRERNAGRVDPTYCSFVRLYVETAARILQRVGFDAAIGQFPHARGAVKPPKKENVILLREAGGFGDIVSLSAAGRAVKAERGDVNVVACIPTDFMGFASHLDGLDQVVGVGPLSQIVPRRRERGGPLTDPSIKVAIPEGEAIDLWCPAWKHERDADGPLFLTRAAIFAAAAGCTDLQNAIPIWRFRGNEVQRAGRMLWSLPISPDKPIIGFAPRGTAESRSLSLVSQKALMGRLAEKNMVIYLDGVPMPSSLKHPSVFAPHVSIEQSVAFLPLLDGLLTVDTSWLHLGVATATPTMCLHTWTDPTPYRRHYPLYRGLVGVAGPLPSCQTGPCNGSPQRGHSAACEAQCARAWADAQVDRIAQDFETFIKAASNPLVQEFRAAAVKQNGGRSA